MLSSVDGALVFVGDVFLQTAPRRPIASNGACVFNLEASLARNASPVGGKVNLAMDAGVLRRALGGGQLVACLANNHSMDYGPEGLAETMRALDVLGIRHYGAGSQQDNLGNPLVLDIQGRKVALCGYVSPDTRPATSSDMGFGPALLEVDRIASDVRVARKLGCEHIVVSVHWGIEEVGQPTPADVVLAQKMIALGADLVIGHHSHCIQPFSTIRGKEVYWGLGTFMAHDFEAPGKFVDGLATETFRYRQRPWTRRSLVVAYDVDSGRTRPTVWNYDGVAVAETNLPADRWRLGNDPDLDDCAARFRKSLFWCTWRNRIVDYLHNPHFPKSGLWKSLKRIIRRSREPFPISDKT